MFVLYEIVIKITTTINKQTNKTLCKKQFCPGSLKEKNVSVIPDFEARIVGKNWGIMRS